MKKNHSFTNIAEWFPCARFCPGPGAGRSGELVGNKTHTNPSLQSQHSGRGRHT